MYVCFFKRKRQKELEEEELEKIKRAKEYEEEWKVRRPTYFFIKCLLY